ncbi:DUF4124 domain-containing protein [Chitinimonas sp.]|uniref:DUF4124 domain-containing protein n=1 Tax=Chitinimonas sp. TaxID=1934313 RepID=UPI002F923664
MLRPLLITLLLTMPLLGQAGERLYKWVDENGKVQYSDKPPLQQNQKGMTELNRQGQTVRQFEGVLTPEQRAAKEAELQKQRAEMQKQEEARRRDKALMSSFNKTGEIDAIRDRNIEQLNAGIQSDQIRLGAVRKRIETFDKQVERLNKAKRPISDSLQADIRDANAELAKLTDHIEQQKQDIEQTNIRAEADKKRLIELRGEGARSK